MTIVEFLAARMDEEEAEANAAAFCSSPEWVALGSLLLELHCETANPEII